MNLAEELRDMAKRYTLSEHIYPLLIDAAAELDRSRSTLANWMTKYGAKASECHELRIERDKYKAELEELARQIGAVNMKQE